MSIHERISQNMALSFDDALFDIGRPGPAGEWLLSQNLDHVAERERQFQAAYDASTPAIERTCFECGGWLDDDYNCRPCAAMED